MSEKIVRPFGLPGGRYAVRGRALPILGASLLAIGAARAEPAASIRLLRATTVVEADGRAVQTIEMQIAVANDAAARADAQQSLTYTSDIEDLELIEGYTQKPDGRRIPVLPGAIRTQLAPGTPNVPEFTNRKQIVAVLPDAAGGDLLSVTWRRTVHKPVFSGQYANTHFFIRTLAWDNAEISVSLPASMTLTREEHGPGYTVAEEGGRRVHRWHWNAPPQTSDQAALSPLDRAPRLFLSTFADWPAFSRTYAGLFAPKTAVTPAIQALADEVASGATTKREEAQRLYEWVSRRVRWVAIYVGDGAFVPHAADQVLANRYGDCKDQVALLVALLRARGIVAEPVLVNLTPTYTLSGPPTLSAFNHVITYLPDWELYADTTAGGAPFGTVQAQSYGKPILHVTAAGAGATRLAPMPPGLATERLQTTMILSAEGVVTGKSVTDSAGPYATVLRQFANRVLARGGAAAAADQLRSLGQAGGGVLTPGALDTMGPDYQMRGHFTLEPHPEWLDGDGFALPTGLRLLPRPGDGMLGPLSIRDLPVAEPTPCYAGEQTEELSLELPPGYHPARLPRPRQVADAAFSYDSRWTFAEGTVSVRRKFVSRIDQPLCEGALRLAAAKALEEIRRDIAAQITLEKDG